MSFLRLIAFLAFGLLYGCSTPAKVFSKEDIAIRTRKLIERHEPKNANWRLFIDQHVIADKEGESIGWVCNAVPDRALKKKPLKKGNTYDADVVVIQFSRTGELLTYVSRFSNFSVSKDIYLPEGWHYAGK